MAEINSSNGNFVIALTENEVEWLTSFLINSKFPDGPRAEIFLHPFINVLIKRMMDFSNSVHNEFILNDIDLGKFGEITIPKSLIEIREYIEERYGENFADSEAFKEAIFPYRWTNL